MQASSTPGPVYLVGAGRLAGTVDRRVQVPVRLPRRPRGEHADGVLGQVPPQRGREPVGVRVGAQPPDQVGHGVRAVVVAGPAAEGESAGHRERAVRVVQRQAELLGRDLDRGREAGVEVDVPDVGHRHARVAQRGGADRADRRRGGELGPLGDEPLVPGRGAGVQEDPAVLVDPGRLGRGRAAQDQPAGEVDGEVGAEQLAVGRGDHPVVRRDGRELLGRARARLPGVRVAGRDLREARPQAVIVASWSAASTPAGRGSPTRSART